MDEQGDEIDIVDFDPYDDHHSDWPDSDDWSDGGNDIDDFDDDHGHCMIETYRTLPKIALNGKPLYIDLETEDIFTHDGRVIT